MEELETIRNEITALAYLTWPNKEDLPKEAEEAKAVKEETDKLQGRTSGMLWLTIAVVSTRQGECQ